MQLSVRDACRLLNVPERTLYRWIRAGSLPACKVGDDYRFNRVELVEWATRERMSISPELFRDREEEDKPSIADALREGGVHDGVAGRDKRSVLDAVVARLRLPPAVDRAFLLAILMARESLGSTGVGDGIAIPHVRNPVVLELPRPQVALCYLDAPVEFAAPDGQPVSVLFTVLSPTVRIHLRILSGLAFLLKQPEFREAVRKRRPLETIAPIAERLEARMQKGGEGEKPPPPQSGITRY